MADKTSKTSKPTKIAEDRMDRFTASGEGVTMIPSKDKNAKPFKVPEAVQKRLKEEADKEKGKAKK